jgi:hypothetical protein
MGIPASFIFQKGASWENNPKFHLNLGLLLWY